MSTPSKSITKKSDGWDPRSIGVGALVSVSTVWRRPSEAIRLILFETTSSTFVQFLRYGFVGGIAFLFDFGTLWFATSWLGVHYLLSAAAGFSVGLLVNYALSVRWVFERRKFESKFVQFGLFALVGIVGIGINELVMWLLTDRVGWHYLASKVAATGVVYVWNFSIRKALIF